MLASSRPRIPKDAEARLLEAQRRAKKLGDNLQAWHVELSHMRSLSKRYGLGLHDDHVNTFDLCDGSVVQVGMPTISVVEAPSPLSIGDDSPGPWIVYPDAPDKLTPLRSAGFLIAAEYMPVLVVNLDAADRHIIAEVGRVLRERKSKSMLLRTPGAYSLSRSLKEKEVIARWQRYHIIEVMELMCWRASQGDRGDKYTDILLGSWIDSQYLTSPNMVDAIDLIRDAIASLPAILAEMHPETIERRPPLYPK